MTEYFIVNDVPAAERRSGDAWLDYLGNPKKPEDITAFMWGWLIGLDGQCALVIDQHKELLDPAEQDEMVTELPPDNWPPPPDLDAI